MAKKSEHKISLISYFTNKFKTKREISEFEFACIGPSKDSPVAGGCAEIGQIINLEFCLKQRCICDYSMCLNDVYSRLGNDEPSESNPELVEIAKSLLVEPEKTSESTDENHLREPVIGKQKPRTESKGTGGKAKKAKKAKKRKQEVEDAADIQQMLFGE